jgi:trans-aconitate 3-methyltransferase
MTTFAKPTFSAASYAAFRPTYPPALYAHVLAYHRGARATLVDLGTGHGLVARALSPSFRRVLAADPSAGMLAAARAATPAGEYPNVAFRRAAADAGLRAAVFGEGAAEEAADMVVAAQAAHWFDFPGAWAHLAAALRAGGTLALWTYKDWVYVGFPRASRILLDWLYGADRLGPHWEPGRMLVHRNYVDVVPAAGLFEDEERIVYETAEDGVGEGKGECLMKARMSVAQSMDYFRTMSAVHTWQLAHGSPRARKDGGEGDFVDLIYDEMIAAEGWDVEKTMLDIEWGSAIILARKRGDVAV